MAGLFLVNGLDAGRALGPKLSDASPEGVEHFFMTEYLVKRGGRFNHDPAIFTLGDVFRGKINSKQAEHYCLTHGSPAGRMQNAEIARLVAPYAEKHVSSVYKVGYLAIAVGRHRGHTIFLGIKAPFVRLESGAGYLVIPGFRKTFLPSDDQITFPISLAHNQVAKDDLAHVDVEYLYAGPDPDRGRRAFRAIVGSSRELLAIDQLDDLLQVYVSGVARVLDRGLGLGKAQLQGYRVVGPHQSGMF